MLQIPEVQEDVAKELEVYFRTNDIPGSDPGMIWEAHKVVMRGVLIKHGSRLKKAREAQIVKLAEEIQILESQHKKVQTPLLGKELAHLRRQMTDLLRYKAKAAIQSGKKVMYELGDKCSKMLAGKLKEKGKSAYVPHIKGENGQMISLPKDIAQRFREYYSSLYNLKSIPASRDSMEEYLSSARLFRLSSPDRNSLEAPITIEELSAVIKTVKHGKAPGPDGFTIQYYKNFFPLLGRYMTKAFNEIGRAAALPPDSLMAHILVIPKEGKDPAECGSYRPISLLNVDLKLFTKLLASRLQPLLNQLVHLDQVGFIPTREARDNTIKVLNLVHHANKTKTPSIFLSTDAKKAFDRVSWRFMFGVLRHMGLGEHMLRWIAGVYASPQARVKVNGVYSEPIKISNGRRQGCPLSPMLFALSLEPLLNKIRQNPDIQGLQIGDRIYKISAYADNLLFTLSSPHVSLPNLMKEVEGYSVLANLKINYAKSEVMGVALPLVVQQTVQPNFKFKWVGTALKYLGT